MSDQLADRQKILSTFYPAEGGRIPSKTRAWWREASYYFYFYVYTQLGGSLLHALWRRT